MGELSTKAIGTGNQKIFLESLLESLSNVYEVEDREKNIYILMDGFAKVLSDIDREIQAGINDHFLEIAVENESITRSAVGSDKLTNESAFQIDSVRFWPTWQVTQEIKRLTTLTTEVILQNVPDDYTSILIYEYGDIDKKEITTVSSYDSDTNTITIDALSEDKTCVIEYIDTGDTKDISETISLGLDLFEWGYGEGGYGNYGYGE